MNASSVWLLFLAAALGTLLLRTSFLTLFRSEQLPEIVRRGLKLLPAAVLAGLSVPALVPTSPEIGSLSAWVRPIALIIAFAVAWRWRNMLLTIGAGMISLWVLRFLS
jgi:branched-subunit amino acid transport protein